MNILTSSTKGAQLFFILFLIGTILGIVFYDLGINTVLLILLGYFLYGCIGIVVTFHRYLTHKSYETSNTFVKLFSLLGCFAGTGSPLAWVAIHINHHLKSDKENDPHSPLYRGLKIFSLSYESQIDRNTKWRMRELISNRYQQFLHRYYFLILLSWSLVLFLIGGFYLMIFLHWAPAVITVLMSNMVNYIGHKPNWLGGFRRYNLSDQSTNNWLWAIPSWGETWHNNHHRHPKNFSCGEKWWEIDIASYVIRLIKV
jgi:stearoyl-CoA desaturase (delta-9 desaturase)